MRLIMLECDWKDNLTGKEFRKACKQVGGEEQIYDFDQDDVDSKIWFVCSHELREEQLRELWIVGDLYTCDGPDDGMWKGRNYEGILKKIDIFAKSQPD